MIPSDDLSHQILNLCNDEIREKYRKVERNILKITGLTSHLLFNETCLNRQIINNLDPSNMYVIFGIKTLKRKNRGNLKYASTSKTVSKMKLTV